MAQKFEFICSGPSIEFNDDVKFAARSHTAKVNRRKRTLSRRPRAPILLGVKPTQSAALMTRTGLGAGECEALDLSSPSVVDVIDFTFRGALQAAFTQDEIRNWFQGFCEDPMLFYAWTHNRAFVQYRQMGCMSNDLWRRMIASKSSAYPLIQQSLISAGDHQPHVERLLLAMSITSPYDSDLIVSDDLPLCRPHMLYDEGFDVFRTRILEGYLPAAALLVKRIPGGLWSLKDRGLIRMIAMLDLVSAASEFRRPLLQCGWYPPAPMDCELYQGKSQPGDGFARLGLSTLPRLDTFLNICRLDCFMAQFRGLNLDVQGYLNLLDWRNSAVYALLALPGWEQLSEDEQATSFQDFYECCRLATILYTGAIICAVPAQSAGILGPLCRLVDIFQQGNLVAWRQDLRLVALWSMFVSGIVAYNTVYWAAIVHELRELIHMHKVTTLAEVHLILEPFLWSESAIAAGAKVLWDAVTRQGCSN